MLCTYQNGAVVSWKALKSLSKIHFLADVLSIERKGKNCSSVVSSEPCLRPMRWVRSGKMLEAPPTHQSSFVKCNILPVCAPNCGLPHASKQHHTVRLIMQYAAWYYK